MQYVLQIMNNNNRNKITGRNGNNIIGSYGNNITGRNGNNIIGCYGNNITERNGNNVTRRNSI